MNVYKIIVKKWIHGFEMFCDTNTSMKKIFQTKTHIFTKKTKTHFSENIETCIRLKVILFFLFQRRQNIVTQEYQMKMNKIKEKTIDKNCYFVIYVILFFRFLHINDHKINSKINIFLIWYARRTKSCEIPKTKKKNK